MTLTNLGPYSLNTIYTGDARILAESIPDNSVDLIFTDPIYQNIDDYQWLAETTARVLKSGKSVLAFCGHSYTIPAGAAMLGSGLIPGPILEHYVSGSVGRLFSHSVQCNVLPCLWFSKGQPDNEWMCIQELSTPNGQRGHFWGKAEDMAMYRISRFTQIRQIIVDFFCGGGSTPAVCRKLGRNYWGCEIDPATADLARKRVEMTQPPLFVLQPEQAEFTI